MLRQNFFENWDDYFNDSSASDDNSSASEDDSSANDSRLPDSHDDTLLHSTDLTMVLYKQPEPMEESSVVDSVYEATHAETGEQVPEYQIIKSSSQRQDKLIDREGYAISVTCKRGPTTYWHCFVQNKTINCKATMIQLFEEEWPNEAGATGIC